MHGSKTLSWYSQLPRDATEGSQLALSDIFYSHAQESPTFNRHSIGVSPRNPFDGIVPIAESTLRRTSSQESLRRQVSFEIQRVTDLKKIDPGWEDPEIEEVLVLSRKRHTKKLSVIKESVDSGRGKKVDISSFKLARLILDSVATKVLLGTIHGSSKCYMIKVIRQELVDAKGFQEVIREHRLLKFVTQNKLPFLPRLFWSFLDANHLYIVNGYASEPLHGMLDRNNSSFGDETLFYISELVVAVSALHSSGIVLRCILPDDIRLADDGHLVLTGLAHAAYLSHPNMECQANVSPPIHECPDHLGEEEIQFSAPELLLGWSYDTKVDVWSIGMFLYVLLVGKHPFLDSTEKTIERDAQDNHDLLLRAALQSESLASLNDDVAVLISQCLERNTSLRASMDSLCTHPYFRSVNWADVKSRSRPCPVRPTVPDLIRTQVNLPLYFEPPQYPNQPYGAQELPSNAYWDDLSFEWPADEHDHLSPSQADDNAQAISVLDNPLSASGSVSSGQTAQSTALSVTSFGELKRFRRIPVPPAGAHLPKAKPGSSAQNPSHPHVIQRRQSGPLASLQEVTPPSRGQLRKYASLNFDSDTIVSLSQDGSESDTQSLSKTPLGSKTAPLANLPRWSPLKSFKFPRSNTISSPSAHSTNENFLALGDTSVPVTKKVLKKRTPVIPPSQQPPQVIPSLPQGVEQIGSGIGFTYTRSPSQPIGTSDHNKTPSSNASTPRRSLSFLNSGSRYGGLTSLPRLLRKPKANDGISSSDSFHSPDITDDLDSSVRYSDGFGSALDWDLDSTSAAVRSAAGLGFGLGTGDTSSSLLMDNTSNLIAPRRVHFGEDNPGLSSNAGFFQSGARAEVLRPKSTLRLVTPKTPQQQRLWRG